jgi:hypothetical protein
MGGHRKSGASNDAAVISFDASFDATGPTAACDNATAAHQADCQDTTPPQPGLDAGMRPGFSTDAGMRPRFEVDASTDPITPCDRFDPDACPSGQQCDVLIRAEWGAPTFFIMTGCVERSQELGEGAPCGQWGDFQTPYDAPGVTDEVYTDPCEPGLFCAPDLLGGGAPSCQRACMSGRFDAQIRRGCDETQYCVGERIFEEVCIPSSGCDPVAQTGCEEGEACYLRLGDDARSVLSVCLAPQEPSAEDGQPCDLINACAPGSWCWSAIERNPSSWALDDLRCHPSCDASGDDGDAGSDGRCGEGTTCKDFSLSGLDSSPVGVPFAQCE